MTSQALNSVRDHWPEYLIEAAGLGSFMIPRERSGPCWNIRNRPFIMQFPTHCCDGQET
jgi:hypothetical protein